MPGVAGSQIARAVSEYPEAKSVSPRYKGSGRGGSCAGVGSSAAVGVAGSGGELSGAPTCGPAVDGACVAPPAQAMVARITQLETRAGRRHCLLWSVDIGTPPCRGSESTQKVRSAPASPGGG